MMKQLRGVFKENTLGGNNSQEPLLKIKLIGINFFTKTSDVKLYCALVGKINDGFQPA